MRILFIIACLLSLSACSYLGSVIPDKSKEYKKSIALPDLEIPPDLTAEATNQAMMIPGEKLTSLSQYKRQRSGTAGQPVLAQGLADEQRLSVRGSALEIWPKLRIFFADKGYTLDLDDAELGVLETNWSEPVIEGGFIYRNKFKIFSESGDVAGNTLLFVSGTRQEQLNKDGGEPEWIDQGKNIDIAELLAGELNLYLSGMAQQQQSSAAASQTVSRQAAEILDAGEGKFYLSIPEEFSRAWQQIEVAIQRVGFIVDDKDRDKGLYFITYFDSVDDTKKGWFSKMAFWRDDESVGKVYQISLTGVGEKTEMIILNKDGDWETGNDASRIISLIHEQYNQL